MILRGAPENWQELAHPMVGRRSPFAEGVQFANLRDTSEWSTHHRSSLTFNYRYPSPSHWSGLSFQVRPDLIAGRRCVADHNSGDRANFAFVSYAKHNKIDAGQEKGSETWTTGRSAWRWLAPHSSQDVSLTKANAPLPVRRPVRLSPMSPATTYLSVQQQAQPQARFATTRACVTKEFRGAGQSRARISRAGRPFRPAPQNPDNRTTQSRAGAVPASRGLACPQE